MVDSDAFGYIHPADVVDCVAVLLTRTGTDEARMDAATDHRGVPQLLRRVMGQLNYPHIDLVGRYAIPARRPGRGASAADPNAPVA